MITQETVKRNMSYWIKAAMAEQEISEADIIKSLWPDEKIDTRLRMRVNRWCKGQVVPDVCDLIRLADLLGYYLEELFAPIPKQRQLVKPKVKVAKKKK